MKKVLTLLSFSCFFSQLFAQATLGDIGTLFGDPGSICINGSNTSLSIAAQITNVSGAGVFWQWTTSDGFTFTGMTSGSTTTNTIIGITVNPGTATASTTARTVTFQISDDNTFNESDESGIFDITVNDLPNANIATPDGTAVCSSGSPSIALNGGLANSAHSISGWQWSGGSSATTQSISTTTAATYNLVATNFCGTDASAASQEITSSTVPSISTQPVNLPTSGNLCIDDNANFTVTAGGTGPTFQWQKKAPADGTFSNISGGGATTSSVTVTSTNSAGAYPDQTQFRVLIEVSACPENDLFSNTAILTVTSDVDVDGALDAGVSISPEGTYTYTEQVTNASSATVISWSVAGTTINTASGGGDLNPGESSSATNISLGSSNTVTATVTNTSVVNGVFSTSCQIYNPNDGFTVSSNNISLSVSSPCGSDASAVATFEALPIELKHFRGSDMGDYIALNWATATEINNDFFSVERSWDGEQFTEIVQIKGAGDSYLEQTYSYSDMDAKQQAPEATVYYRLRQTDFDGAFSFSNVISLPLEKRPTFDIIEMNEMEGELEINFSTASTSSLDARVYDFDGNLLTYRSISPEAGFNSLTINTSALNEGMYLLVLVNGEQVVTRRFVKF